MDHLVRRRPVEISGGEVLKILLGSEHVRALIIDVEEVLEIGEAIGRPDLVD
jgi:hypothetical protein